MLNQADISVIDQLADFYLDDLESLEKMKETAGKGEPGRHESYLLSMAIYYHENMLEYMNRILDNAKLPVGEASKSVDNVPVRAIDPMAPTPKSEALVKQTQTTISHNGNTYTVLNSVPSHREIEDVVREVLAEVPQAEDQHRPGFVGWLVAETQRKIQERGGRSDPKQVLKIALDVRAEQEAVNAATITVKTFTDEELNASVAKIAAEIEGIADES